MNFLSKVIIRCGLFICLLFTISNFSFPVLAYEDEPVVYLSDILTPELRQSLKHRVEDVEVSQGIFNFFLQSDFGSFNVSTMGMLRERVKEILILGNTINQFLSQEDQFSGEIRGQLVIRSDRATDIIKKPVSSATNLAGQVVENLNETLTGAVPETEKAGIYKGGESDDPVRSLHKRNVASQWQLDVYSTNPRVQEFLNAVASVRASGNISAGAPSLNRYSIPPLKVKNDVLEMEIRSVLKQDDVDALLENNEQILAGLDIDQDLRTAFLQDPSYSPRHKTRISYYLSTLGGDIDLSGLIRAALGSNDESGSLAFEHLVMMISDYHLNRNSLREIQPVNSRLVSVMAEENSMITFVVQDLIYWNEVTESRYDRLRRRAVDNGSQSILVTSGFVTEEAKKQLQDRGYTIMPQSLY